MFRTLASLALSFSTIYVGIGTYSKAFSGAFQTLSWPNLSLHRNPDLEAHFASVAQGKRKVSGSLSCCFGSCRLRWRSRNALFFTGGVHCVHVDDWSQ